MKTKYIIGIIAALLLVFAAVATTNAAQNGKKNKFINAQETVSIQLTEIVSVYAEELAQSEYVDINGDLKGKVRSRNYITVTGDSTTNYVVREVTDFEYYKDFENPDNDNTVKKAAIQQGITSKYGYSIPLQNIFYSKKTRGNQ